MIATPPAEWRRRSTDGIPLADMPLRTVKTILQQVVAVYGEAVFEKLYEIDAAENSYVYQYLFRLVNSTSTASGSNGAMSRVGSTTSTSSLSKVVVAPNDSPPLSSHPVMSVTKQSEGAIDIAMNQKLRIIFDRIGDPGQSRAGIAELYEYRKKEPLAEAKIQLW